MTIKSATILASLISFTIFSLSKNAIHALSFQASAETGQIDPEVLTQILDPILGKVRVDRNTSAIKWIAQETDSTLIIADSARFIPSLVSAAHKGRDNKHPGEVWNKEIAEEFYDRIMDTTSINSNRISQE